MTRRSKILIAKLKENKKPSCDHKKNLKSLLKVFYNNYDFQEIERTARKYGSINNFLNTDPSEYLEFDWQTKVALVLYRNTLISCKNINESLKFK